MTEEKILEPILEYYMNIPIDSILNENIKEKYEIITNMRIIIYTNERESPHFHVKSDDGNIDAYFSVENCEFIGGHIDVNNFKRVKAFYSDPKSQIVMKKIWDQWRN